ncbi:MAG TPA: hypothetical protein VFZ00_15820 [Solirubrobacter sp.]|nr:hypothetical protein [Solirubrobacter sp.]
MRLLVLDIDDRVRCALQDVFQAELGAHVTAAASVPAVARTQAFDVAVVDERIASGISSEGRLRLEALARHVPVVVIGLGERVPYEDAHIAAGAMGYWPKDGDLDALIALVRSAYQPRLAAA